MHCLCEIKFPLPCLEPINIAYIQVIGYRTGVSTNISALVNPRMSCNGIANKTTPTEILVTL